MKRRAIPELKVFFDTNALFTSAASHLTRREVGDFIVALPTYQDLRISWHLPEVVVEERRFQMVKAAQGLLPSFRKMERLLGMSFDLADERLGERVASAIERDRARLNLNFASLDFALVDWKRLIDSAARREPPFEPEKEKGFRDAIAVETFLQEVDRSPKTRTLCLLAMVSADPLVGAAIKGRTISATNVRILSDLEELKGLINTLISSVDEDYVNGVAGAAAQLFYDFSTKTGLYTTADVRKKVTEKFTTLFYRPPPDIDKVTEVTNFIHKPQFVSKAAHVLTWTSRWVVVQALQRKKAAPSGEPGETVLVSNTGASNLGLTSSLATTRGAAAEFEEVRRRELVFQVRWTCRATAQRKLSQPKLLDIVSEQSQGGESLGNPVPQKST